MATKSPVIPTKDLSIINVPDIKAALNAIFEFALTFDPRELENQGANLGKLDDLGDKSSLPEFRAHLYFEQRRWNHYGQLPDTKSETQLRWIVKMIRERLSPDFK